MGNLPDCSQLPTAIGCCGIDFHNRVANVYQFAAAPYFYLVIIYGQAEALEYRHNVREPGSVGITPIEWHEDR